MLDPRHVILNLTLAVCGLTSIACGESESGCKDRDEQIAFDEKSALGFSMEDAVRDREAQSSVLTWSEAPSWLPFSQTATTGLSTKIEPASNTARVMRSADTDCRLILRSEARLSIATEDRAFEFNVDALVDAQEEDLVQVSADITKDVLVGEFELPSEVHLSFIQEVHADGSVEGKLLAWSTQTDSERTTFRSAQVASWTGSIGAIELDLDLDAGTPLDASSPTEDPLVFDEGVDGIEPADAAIGLDGGPTP